MATAIHLIYRRLVAALFAVLAGLWAAEGFPLHGTLPHRWPAAGWITGVTVFVVAEIVGRRSEQRATLRRTLAQAQAIVLDEQLRASTREAHNRPLPGAAPQTPGRKAPLYAVPDAPQEHRRRPRWLMLLTAALILFVVPTAAHAGERHRTGHHCHARRHHRECQRARTHAPPSAIRATAPEPAAGEPEGLTAAELAEVEREVEEQPDPAPYPAGEEITVAAEPAQVVPLVGSPLP